MLANHKYVKTVGYSSGTHVTLILSLMLWGQPPPPPPLTLHIVMFSYDDDTTIVSTLG